MSWDGFVLLGEKAFAIGEIERANKINPGSCFREPPSYLEHRSILVIHRGVKVGNFSTPKSDVILLGSGLGGLIGGTLLCQKGCSVLLLREKDYQPLYERERYRFVPFSNFSERRFNPSLLPLALQRVKPSRSGLVSGKTLAPQKKK